MRAAFPAWRRALALVLLALAGRHAAAQSVHLTLAMAPGIRDAVLATYELPRGMDVLRFAGEGRLRQRAWQVVEGGDLSADGLALVVRRGARRVRVVMTAAWQDGEIDRAYTPLLPFGDGRAVAVYSEYLLPKGGGDVRMVHVGRDASTAMPPTGRWQANDASTYLLVGHPAHQDARGFSLTHDGTLPAWVVDFVEANVPRLIEAYATLSGARPSRRPWVLLVDISGHSAHGLDFRGDTNPGMLRLGLQARDWQDDTESRRATLGVFLAHELFHLWNAEQWQATGPGLEWLYEGGADAVAWETATRLGMVSPARFEQARAEAFVRCAAVSGDTLAAKLARGGKSPYTCGAALFEYATLPRASASALWQRMFARTRATHAYGRDDFLRAIPVDADAARVADLLANEAPWEASLDAATKAGRLRLLDDGSAVGDGVAALLLDQLVIHAVLSDCAGASDVFFQDQAYTIGALPQCRQLKTPLVARRLAGIDMHQQPAAALDAAKRECRAHGTIPLSGADGDHEVSLPCDGWRIESAHYRIPVALPD